MTLLLCPIILDLASVLLIADRLPTGPVTGPITESLDSLLNRLQVLDRGVPKLFGVYDVDDTVVIAYRVRIRKRVGVTGQQWRDVGVLGNGNLTGIERRILRDAMEDERP